jgi:hypothetical protein
MPEPVVTDMPFPVSGLATDDAYAEQRPGTTPDAVNVRTQDSFEDRARGGSRPGLAKYISQRLPLV